MTDKKEKETLPDSELIETLQNQLADSHDLYLRALAEVENVKHRAHLDIQRKSQIALENFAKDLLPVLDNFERAMKSLNGIQASEDMKNLLMGLDFIYQDLLKAVEKNGFEFINQTSVPFDPVKHKAIDYQLGEPDVVLEIKQSGYMLNGRILREALVIVGKK